MMQIISVSHFYKALKIVADCIGEDKIGFIYRPITINTRAKKRWGVCHYGRDGKNKIEISKIILEDNIPDEPVMIVLIHEILHACKDGQSHKNTWKEYASMVTKKYPQYPIKRTLEASAFGIKTQQSSKKYAIKCTKCGNIHYSSRLSKTITRPSRYRCGKCGGKLKRIK